MSADGGSGLRTKRRRQWTPEPLPADEAETVRVRVSVLAFAEGSGDLLLSARPPAELCAAAWVSPDDIHRGDSLRQVAYDAAVAAGLLASPPAGDSEPEVDDEADAPQLATILEDPSVDADASTNFHFIFVLARRLHVPAVQLRRSAAGLPPLRTAAVADLDPLADKTDPRTGKQVPARTAKAATEKALRVGHYMDQALRFFRPLEDGLLRVAKRTVRAWPAGTDVFPHDAADLRLYAYLDPVTYMFDHPGKGVRSMATGVLREQFSILDGDVEAIMSCVDRFHEASLVIDDIEDDSDLRRDSEASHIRFGVPQALNAAYLCVFAMLDSVPRLFSGHTELTQSILTSGFVEAHKGQGADIVWRERCYCPTLHEYVEMIRGKTSTPFVAAATLFFIHSCDLRLRALRMRDAASRLVVFVCSMFVWLALGWWWSGWGRQHARSAPAVASLLDKSVREEKKSGDATELDMRRLQPLWALEGPAGRLLSEEEQAIIRLYDRIGIFFQIRDDFINLTSPEYWEVKGFCDDIHERKFSYPIILMIRGRLGRWQDLLALYAKKEPLDRADLEAGLSWVTESGALGLTHKHLLELQTEIHREVRSANLEAELRPLLTKLRVADTVGSEAWIR